MRSETEFGATVDAVVERVEAGPTIKLHGVEFRAVLPLAAS
jgi:hypothetical protein